MPTFPDDATKAELQAAISTVSDARLRAIVAKLAQSIPEFETAMIKELLAHRPNSKTRKVASRWATCRHCKEEFDLSEERDEEECSYHPGKLECQYDRFEDWDEDCHGPMNTKSNRIEFPDNFAWSCCKEDGTAEGCEQGEHVARAKKKARRDQ